ncbi:MAG: hypothetical protein C0613_05505 [Desulfobulbaceae bacterium]|nr:MAG: hypothetical protein C0613_05505 [Desulfobulbaceae bacterium]
MTHDKLIDVVLYAVPIPGALLAIIWWLIAIQTRSAGKVEYIFFPLMLKDYAQITKEKTGRVGILLYLFILSALLAVAGVVFLLAYSLINGPIET